MSDDPTTRILAAVELLGGKVDAIGSRVDAIGGKVIFGDMLFSLGIPIELHTYTAVRRIGRLVLPLITKLPFKWFYPTGEKQDERKPKFEKVWKKATLIAGDTLFIRRYAPDNLKGKTILTQTVRKADLDWLKSAGVDRVITTTPVMGGETFATNVMEGVIVALLGRKPSDISEQDYLETLKRLDWKPNEIKLAEG